MQKLTKAQIKSIKQKRASFLEEKYQKDIDIIKNYTQVQFLNFLSNGGCICRAAEIFLIIHNDDEKTHSYILKHGSFSKEAEMLMIKKCNDRIISAYASRTNLRPESEVILTKLRSKEVITHYEKGKWHSCHQALCYQASAFFVLRFGSIEERRRLLTCRLEEDALNLFLSQGNEEEIYSYMEKFYPNMNL